MARYTRRRVRTRRTRRKTSRRSTRRTGRRTRTGPRRGGIKAGSVYNFVRNTDVSLYNVDPTLGAPQIASTNVAILTQIIVDPTTVTLDGHTNFGFSMVHSASNIPNFSEFANLFDFYRISKVTVKIVPVFGAGVANTTGYSNELHATGVSTGQQSVSAFAVPTLNSVSDRDTNEPLTFVSSLEMAGVRRHRMSGAHTDSFSPVPSMPVGQSTAGPSLFNVIPKRAPWLTTDTAGLTVQHYGRRYGVIDWPGPNTGIGVEGDAVPCMWRFYTTYHIQCKGLR